MKRLTLVAAFLIGCSSTSTVFVESDPLTGADTAYATAFLDGPTTRLVLSAPVGAKSAVHLTLWQPAAAAPSCDEAALVVGDHSVRGAEIDARTVETPSGTDHTIAFTLPPGVVRDAAERSGRVDACDRSWPLDAEDRRVLRDFVYALRAK